MICTQEPVGSRERHGGAPADSVDLSVLNGESRRTIQLRNFKRWKHVRLRPVGFVYPESTFLKRIPLVAYYQRATIGSC